MVALTQAKLLVVLETRGNFLARVSQFVGDLGGGVEERRLERREHKRVAAKDRAPGGHAREAREGIVRAVVVVEDQGLRGGAEGPVPEEHHQAEDAQADRHRDAGV